MLSAQAVEGLPEIGPGDDLGALLVAAGPQLVDDDVLVIAHKVVSKREGQIRTLRDVTPGDRALQLAAELDKDPRHVQVILEESTEVLRAERGVLICVSRHGFVCANAGVDRSNAPADDAVILLPADPDASARELRARIVELTGAHPGVIISDSFGRAWRHGQCDVAVGCAGVQPLEDWRGRSDATGRQLTATWIAVADQLAAAADLARTKDSAQPVVVVHRAGRFITSEDGPGAAALIRPKAEDLFR